jgi:hypothetical protein
MAAPETRNLSIMLTDIKGFTDKTSHKTRADIQTMLDEHRSVVLPILENGGGRLIKTIGDAFLMTFESPTNAGRSADDRLDIRIAINSGEINLVDGDVFGEPVNITARIEGIAEAGQVYFTEAVYLAMNKAEVPSSEIGLMQLKGISEKIRVYKARREEPVGAASAASSERSGLRRFLPPLAAGAAPATFADGVKAVLVVAPRGRARDRRDHLLDPSELLRRHPPFPPRQEFGADHEVLAVFWSHRERQGREYQYSRRQARDRRQRRSREGRQGQSFDRRRRRPRGLRQGQAAADDLR